MGQLAQEGLVVAEPYRGLRVAGLDAAALRDLARTRTALDLLAAEGILADGTGRRLVAVRQAWATFEGIGRPIVLLALKRTLTSSVTCPTRFRDGSGFL